jgi:outer membrane biosynthesis protein TonB
MATKSDNGQKVLRIGIVQRGKIIDERELKRRETVSVGTASRAMFQVASDALPEHFDLFDYDGKDYFIRYTPEMEGRIQSSGSKVQTFADFDAAGQVSERKGAPAVPLPDSSRGKVIIGDVTVLFQFKTRAAAPARPVLPAELRGSFMQTIDTQFATILTVVAVVCISIVAYARSLPYVEPTSIEEIDKRFQRLIMPDRIPQPPKKQVAEVDEGAGEDEPEEPVEKKEPEKKKPEKKKGDSSDKPAKASREEIKKQVAGKGLLKVLGANREGGGGALADVFSEDDGGSSLSDAFSGVQGVDIAGSAGQKGTRGGGSGEGVGIGDLATEGGGSVQTGQKTETRISGTARAEAPEVDGELDAAKINAVMKRKMSAIKACYESALKRDPKLSGKLVIEMEILEDGRINIEAFSGSLRSSDVESCVRRRARSWRFPRPDGGTVFVSIPIVLTPSS